MTPYQFKRVRLENDFTQADLARLMRCSKRQIQAYEYGECEVPGPVEVIMRLIHSNAIVGGMKAWRALASKNGPYANDRFIMNKKKMETKNERSKE